MSIFNLQPKNLDSNKINPPNFLADKKISCGFSNFYINEIHSHFGMDLINSTYTFSDRDEKFNVRSRRKQPTRVSTRKQMLTED